MSRVHLQDLAVDALTAGELLDRVDDAVRSATPLSVAYVNVHVLNLAARDPELTDILRGADLCYADGAGVVLGARLLGERLPGRMTGADWIWDLAGRAEAEGWRLAWIGGEPGVTDAAVARLRERHPGLRVVHTDHGFHARWDLDALNGARPDVLLVGMGSPVQERWVRDHRDRIDAPVVWCLGATADFVSGKVSRGPAFLHRRQEWLARLLVDPRRLWRRYLLGNPRFLVRVLRERVRRGIG